MIIAQAKEESKSRQPGVLASALFEANEAWRKHDALIEAGIEAGKLDYDAIAQAAQEAEALDQQYRKTYASFWREVRHDCTCQPDDVYVCNSCRLKLNLSNPEIPYQEAVCQQ